MSTTAGFWDATPIPLPRKSGCPDWCRGHHFDNTADGYDGICTGPVISALVEVYAEDSGEVYAYLDGGGPQALEMSRLTAADARALAEGLLAAAEWMGQHEQEAAR